MMFSTLSRSILLLALIGAINFGTHECAVNVIEHETRILNHLLDRNRYDVNAIPVSVNQTTGDVAPVQVVVTMYLLNIEDVDEVKMQFSPQFYFRQKWIDPRLKFDDMNGKIPYLTLSDASRIWRPDTFFSNEISARFHVATKPNMFIRISPSGEVFYSIRLSSTLDCPMNNQMYPHSKQSCMIEIESYGHDAGHIAYAWDKTKTSAAAISMSLHLPRFKATFMESKDELLQLSSGKYSRLILKVHLEPLTHQFVWHLYLPSIALLITSFASFWINPKAKLARATLIAATTVLMVLVLSNANANSPREDYFTMLDQWNIACSIFTFGALIEFVLVYSITKSEPEKVESDVEENKLIDTSVKKCLFKQNQILNRLSHSTTNRFDLMSRMIFPVAFMVFCICYFGRVVSN